MPPVFRRLRLIGTLLLLKAEIKGFVKKCKKEFTNRYFEFFEASAKIAFAMLLTIFASLRADS